MALTKKEQVAAEAHKEQYPGHTPEEIVAFLKANKSKYGGR
jgi:hypothetical protein